MNRICHQINIKGWDTIKSNNLCANKTIDVKWQYLKPLNSVQIECLFFSLAY